LSLLPDFIRSSLALLFLFGFDIVFRSSNNLGYYLFGAFFTI